MGCKTSQTTVSISQVNYFPTSNPYLIHYSLKSIPILGVYNFNSNHYTENPLNIEKLYPGCSFCWVDSDRFAIGGGNFNSSTEILEMYLVNILTLKATRLSNMKTSHSEFSLIFHCSELYVISGYNYKNLLSPVVEKCEINGEWVFCDNLQVPRSHSVSVSIKHKIFVAGGNSGIYNQALCNTIEQYDKFENIWKVVPISLPIPSWKMGVCKVTQEKALIFGGESTKGKIFACFEIDFIGLKIHEKAHMPQNKEGWRFLYESKCYKDIVYCIESRLENYLTYHNDSWAVHKLKPDYMQEKV